MPPSTAYNIGTLHSSVCLERFLQQDSWELVKKLDFLEVRLDGVQGITLPSTWPLPMIATARHPEEGGIVNLNCYERRELLEKAIGWASAVDVELRSFRELTETIARSRAEGCLIIASFHDFEKVPSLRELEKMLLEAEKRKADFFKIAVTPHSEKELEQLLLFQKKSSSSPVRVAAMGMGILGAYSRALLANAGAALIYGWVYSPQVVGQWSVEEMLGSKE